ncbi:hypothetical protein DBY68_002690 [Pseudocitrobacter sp. RIT415]|nr:hypothetical protein DBY68_002690 [Pseudocitrobacter sp. RIT 415]
MNALSSIIGGFFCYRSNDD